MQIQFLKNEKPNLGRSYSISIGLQYFESFDFVFIQNIDNPFTSHELLNLMISAKKSDYPIIPQVGMRNTHPVLLPRKFITMILNNPGNTFDFRDFFSSLPKQFIKWDMDNIKANINTQEDYSRWIKQEHIIH